MHRMRHEFVLYDEHLVLYYLVFCMCMYMCVCLVDSGADIELSDHSSSNFVGLCSTNSSSLTASGRKREGRGQCMEAVLRDEAAFVQSVAQYYNHRELSDVLLLIGDDSFYAHKFVLAKSSDVFRAMLFDNVWTEGACRELALNENPDCQNVFDRFLRYMYSAEVSISISTAVGLLCLADKYQVSSLKDLCVKYMVENSRSPHFTNALNWYQWAKALHLPELLKQSARTIAWNCSEIIKSSDWLNMDVDFVVDVLNSSELVISNEFTLWQALSQWLLHESHVSSLKEFAGKLLPLIRFQQMLVTQLFEIERSELAQRDECSSIIHGLLSQAYRFHAICPFQNQLHLRFSELCNHPREYIDLEVDKVRIQNTLRFGIQVDVKTFRGPMASESKDAEWKITYRKQSSSWQVCLIPLDSALIGGEIRLLASLIVLDENEKVIQISSPGLLVCGRGGSVSLQITLDQPDQARFMSLLIKPVPF